MVAEAKAALAAGDPERVHRILLASAGIPAIFPARAIGPHSTSTARSPATSCTARASTGQGVAAQWRAKHGNAPLPRVRYWVIFNNQFRFPPQVTRERWADIMTRATIMATQSATVSAMRHLEAMAELTRRKYGIDVELRVMAVPESLDAAGAGHVQEGSDERAGRPRREDGRRSGKLEQRGAGLKRSAGLSGYQLTFTEAIGPENTCRNFPVTRASSTSARMTRPR